MKYIVCLIGTNLRKEVVTMAPDDFTSESVRPDLSAEEWRNLRGPIAGTCYFGGELFEGHLLQVRYYAYMRVDTLKRDC